MKQKEYSITELRFFKYMFICYSKVIYEAMKTVADY